MIRMKIFKIDPGKFDMAYVDQKGIAKYKKELEKHEKELSPIENFIAEIGFENVRSMISSTGSPYYLAYTIFYEDNLPYTPRAETDAAKKKASWANTHF